jgi:hypothetical protein
MPELEQIFGPDIAFDLRGILIERFGGNMRNEFAHGLMPEGAFYQPTAAYLWWLVLHLCVTGHVQTRKLSQTTKGNASADAGRRKHSSPLGHCSRKIPQEFMADSRALARDKLTRREVG